MAKRDVVLKRCAHPPAAWLKCSCDWYMVKHTHAGRAYRDNVSRYAAEVLGHPITAKTEAEAVVRNVIIPAIAAGTYVSAKDARVAKAEAATAAKTAKATAKPAATIGEAIVAFIPAVILADVKRTKATRGRETTYINRLGDFTPPGYRVPFRALDAAALTDEDIVGIFKAYRTSLATLANSTWAKTRTLMGQFSRYLREKQYRATDAMVTITAHDKKFLKRGKMAGRNRRVDDAELGRLKAKAAVLDDYTYGGAFLVALIVAALETGLRLGELLALQWGDIHLATRSIYVRATEAGAKKTDTPRRVPISAALRAVLDGLRPADDDPRAGRTAYVFGDVTGAKISDRAVWRIWAITVLLAHGHVAIWRNDKLAPASKEKLEQINLHFHDLRHEAGCRWLESKLFDLEQIRQIYGHASIAITARYLHAAESSAFVAMEQYDAYRDRLANEAKTAARLALESGWTGHKRGTNEKRRPAGRQGLRVIKGDKLT